MTDLDRERRMVEYMRKTARIVDERGFAVQTVFGVGAEATSPLFSYTIGMTNRGLPELIMSGPYRPEQLQHVMNKAGDLHLAAELTPGLVLPANELATMPVKVMLADPVKAPVQQAWNYVKDPDRRRVRMRLLQLCWAASVDWIFPDQPGYPVGTPQELWTV